MILYHFTREMLLPSIEESGLLPGTDLEKSSPILTLGIPVVWLTSNCNPQSWMRAFHCDTVVLTVDVKKKRFAHWRTWMEGLEVHEREWTYKHKDVTLINRPAKWEDLSHRHAIIKTRANGTQYDARAGIRRNAKMLDEKPDLVIAFAGGKGTADLVRRAEAARIPVRRIEWELSRAA
jgi:hypothetical protein